MMEIVQLPCFQTFAPNGNQQLSGIACRGRSRHGRRCRRHCPGQFQTLLSSSSLHTVEDLAAVHDLLYQHAGQPQQQSNIFLTTTTTMSTTTTTTTFEPMLPDTPVLIGFAAIVILSGLAAWVWANQVVPISRTNLALDKKRRGPLRDYLNELEDSARVSTTTATTTATSSSYLVENSGSIQMEAQSMLDSATTNYTTTTTDIWLADEESSSNNNDTMTMATTMSTLSPKTRDRAFERWLFSDWLNPSSMQQQQQQQQGSRTMGGGRQKEPALPILKQAKWNSGDNPVLAATALILLGVTMTASVEQILSLVLS